MIIVDLNQVMLSNLMAQLGNHTNAQVEENMIRHMVLNSIRSYKHKFGAEYGELVIACDNTNYWRKQVFPYYKANRKKAIAASELNWKDIFECMNKIRAELKEYFPYRVMDVDSAEADDIIATLCETFGTTPSLINNGSKILILSGDKDFIQLHRFTNVTQYDPVRKKWIKHEDPNMFLNEHIMKGDAGDGIPNVLSDDDCFVTGTRQKPLTAKRMSTLINSIPGKDYDTKTYRNFCRNRELIDLSCVPDKIKETVLSQYEAQAGKDRSKLMGYFITNKLKNLTEYISEF